MVAARRRDLDRRAAGDLPDDVGEVGRHERQALGDRRDRLVVVLAGEQRHQVAQRAEPRGHAGDQGLGEVGQRHDEAVDAGVTRRERGGQHAAHRPHRPSRPSSPSRTRPSSAPAGTTRSAAGTDAASDRS